MDSPNLPVALDLPMADAQPRQIARSKFRGHPVGYREQIRQAHHRRTLGAGIDQHADFRMLGLSVLPSLCRSRQSQRWWSKPITIHIQPLLP